MTNNFLDCCKKTLVAVMVNDTIKLVHVMFYHISNWAKATLAEWWHLLSSAVISRSSHSGKFSPSPKEVEADPLPKYLCFVGEAHLCYSHCCVPTLSMKEAITDLTWVLSTIATRYVMFWGGGGGGGQSTIAIIHEYQQCMARYL